ncbi:MAG: hypothetical protein PHP45_00990 [Elusimicrobiales bacterium]|nr:hypothetical protein [Elusimicrobiales bacterium]
MKKFFIPLFFLTASSAAFAAPDFNYETNVQKNLLTVEQAQPSPDVGWRVFFSSGGSQITSAASSDGGITFSMESGVRIATGPVIDVSSITAFGMNFDPKLSFSTYTAGNYRGYYVAVSSSGFYSILSALSHDQLAWTKDYTGPMIQLNKGSSFLNSPRPHLRADGLTLLYFVGDSAGRGNPGDYRIYYSSSTDHGSTFGTPDLLLNTTAYSIAVSTLTDGRIRMYASAPLANGTGGTTASTIISAVSGAQAAGISFAQEPGVRLSTSAANWKFSSLAVARSSDTYGWRLYTGLTRGASTYIWSAVANVPAPAGIDPNLVYQGDAADSITVAGEIFSVGTPSIALTNGSYSIPLAGAVTRLSDLALRATIDLSSAPVGAYSLTVANADGRTATLAGALYVDYKAGIVKVTDNLFRPLKGGRCRFDITAFNSGPLSLRAYTINGQPVRKIFEGDILSGTTTVYWPGDTDSGQTAASGLYFVTVNGPKIDDIEKVVVIK